MRRLGALLATSTLLLLAFWATRLIALDAFPPFIDEAFHVSVAERIARTHGVFMQAGEGRIFTYWWYLLFQPFDSSGAIWVARVATLLAVLLGVVALIGAGRLAAGRWGAVLAGLVYLFSPYNMFFDRLALSDTLSTAAILLGLYFAYRLSRRTDDRDALLCGLALFAATGAKIGALPYAGIPLAAALTLRPRAYGWRRRGRWLAVSAAALLVPLGALSAVAAWRHQNIYFHLQNSSPSAGHLVYATRIWHNVENAWTMSSAYLGPAMLIALLAGVVILVARREFFLPLVLAAPLLVIVLSERQSTRYYMTPLTVLLLAGAVAWAWLLRGQRPLLQRAALGLVLLWGVWQWEPFAAAMVRNPLELPVTQADRAEYIASDASGFGLAEAAAALQPLAPQRVIGILANCAALRYMMLNSPPVECPRLNPTGEDIPVLADLMAASRQSGTYVVLEDSPYAPDTAPGALVASVVDPSGRPRLAIYNLAP